METGKYPADPALTWQHDRPLAAARTDDPITAREAAEIARANGFEDQLGELKNRLTLMYEELSTFNRRYRDQPIWNKGQGILRRIELALDEIVNGPSRPNQPATPVRKPLTRDERIDREIRMHGTDPSWFGR
jgi:hypothetical protein